MIEYTLIRTPRGSSMTVVVRGELITLTDSEPQFETLLDQLTSSTTPDEDIVYRLATRGTLESVAERMAQISDRVSWDADNETLMVDSKPLHSLLATHIVSNIKTGSDYWERLVRFLDRLSQNPSKTSQDKLYEWLERGGITLAEDGRFIGYKGLEHGNLSRYSGVAFVDGAKVEGQIPNHPGSTITMPRHTVDDDHRRHCSSGLHVGTRSYLEWFDAPLTAVVVVPPEAVVTVPPDHDGTKLRVQEYTVLRVESADAARYLAETGIFDPEDLDEPEDDPDTAQDVDPSEDIFVPTYKPNEL